VLTASESRELRALQQRKHRAERGRFVAEGVRVVEDLLDSSLTLRLVAMVSSVVDTDRGRVIYELASAARVPVRLVEDREFAAIAATESPQGVLAVADIPSRSLADFRLDIVPAVVLVLDAIQDPGNFGTLVRSAEAFGAAGVVALTGTVDPWNPKSVRAAVGSSFRIPVVQMEWAEALTELKSRGFRLLGADVEGASPSRGRTSGERGLHALVVGNEGAGLSPEVRAGIDELIGIPLRGRAESLNVTAAAAILLYELTR
jgi:RNA methyltransferase, TrmH family